MKYINPYFCRYTVPKLLVEQSDFRIVDTELDGVGVVLEVRDGCDALGVERWRLFKLENANLRQLFGYLVRILQERNKA